MHPNSTAARLAGQTLHRRPNCPRDDLDRQAAPIFADLLLAHRRCRWPLVRHLQGVLFDLGFVAETVAGTDGLRLVRQARARKGVA